MKSLNKMPVVIRSALEEFSFYRCTSIFGEFGDKNLIPAAECFHFSSQTYLINCSCEIRALRVPDGQRFTWAAAGAGL